MRLHFLEYHHQGHQADHDHEEIYARDHPRALLVRFCLDQLLPPLIHRDFHLLAVVVDGYWDNVRYHHDGLTDKDVAIAIPESNGTDGSRGSSGMKSERLSAGSVLDPFGDAQREDEAAR